MRKVAVIIVSLLLCLVRSSAQDIKLKGAVVNADDGSAVSFTNIMVYCLPDSTLLGYAISSDDGSPLKICSLRFLVWASKARPLQQRQEPIVC